MPKETTCFSQVNRGDWCQETYESASRDAGIRARQLRKAGYAVKTASLGTQITSIGSCRMTLVHIIPGDNPDTFGLPTDNWKLDSL